MRIMGNNACWKDVRWAGPAPPASFSADPQRDRPYVAGTTTTIAPERRQGEGKTDESNTTDNNNVLWWVENKCGDREFSQATPCITITWPLTITITIATIFTNPMIAKAIPITLATILITVTTILDRVHAWLEINKLVEEPDYYHPYDDCDHLFKPLVELDQLAVQWRRQSLVFWKIKWHLLASRAFLSRT